MNDPLIREAEFGIQVVNVTQTALDALTNAATACRDSATCANLYSGNAARAASVILVAALEGAELMRSITAYVEADASLFPSAMYSEAIRVDWTYDKLSVIPMSREMCEGGEDLGQRFVDVGVSTRNTWISLDVNGQKDIEMYGEDYDEHAIRVGRYSLDSMSAGVTSGTVKGERIRVIANNRARQRP